MHQDDFITGSFPLFVPCLNLLSLSLSSAQLFCVCFSYLSTSLLHLSWFFFSVLNVRFVALCRLLAFHGAAASMCRSTIPKSINRLYVKTVSEGMSGADAVNTSVHTYNTALKDSSGNSVNMPRYCLPSRHLSFFLIPKRNRWSLRPSRWNNRFSCPRRLQSNQKCMITSAAGSWRSSGSKTGLCIVGRPPNQLEPVNVRPIVVNVISDEIVSGGKGQTLQNMLFFSFSSEFSLIDYFVVAPEYGVYLRKVTSPHLSRPHLLTFYFCLFFFTLY